MNFLFSSALHAYCRPATLLAHPLLTVVVADAGAPACHACAPLAIMLAYLRSVTLLALALLAVMLACMRSVTLLGLALLVVMLAYLRSATLLALALHTVVVADAGASAYLAHAAICSCLAWLLPSVDIVRSITQLSLPLFKGTDSQAFP